MRPMIWTTATMSSTRFRGDVAADVRMNTYRRCIGHAVIGGKRCSRQLTMQRSCFCVGSYMQTLSVSKGTKGRDASRWIVRCQASSSHNTILTLPTLLTLGRVAAIPALALAWFQQQWLLCTTLFVGAAVTDFLDGYLARKMVRDGMIFG